MTQAIHSVAALFLVHTRMSLGGLLRCRTTAAIALFAALALAPRVARADSIVVFNEIMYHPATNEAGLEWIELHNQNAIDVDLGGWRLTGGIDFAFPYGTTIRGGGQLVIAVSPSTLMSASGLTNVLGPFAGRLSNGGDEVRLRDNANRLMDSVKYGVDGEWPAGADGSGMSLAKRNPNLASEPPENWIVSRQRGGTPGAPNFANTIVTGGQTNVVEFASTWRYHDGGVDLGAAWRAPNFDDSAWATGPALFFVEDAALPGPKNTPLTPGRSTYYFRTAFNVSGDPSLKLLSVRPVLDDGAVIYLNGLEVQRVNMPTGAITYTTMAAASVPNAMLGAPIPLPASNLVAGMNVLAVELHDSSVVTNAGLRVSRASGYNASWDGGDGDFFSASSPALTPSNAALASLGVEVFTTSNTNLASALTDGRYGASNAWSPATNDASPAVILRFNQTIPVSSIAWSRDNGDASDAGCPGGVCTDRSLGNYTFQYTLNTNPAAVTVNSSNPTNGWTSIATAQYLSAQPGFTPHLRHRFDFTANSGQPILATGMRLRPGANTTIDEIEINPPTTASFDAVFGLELTTTEILPPPPKVAINEISGAGTNDFWLEVINHGEGAVELAGMELVTSSGGYVFPAQSLAPGGIVAVAAPQLGFGAGDGDKVFLFVPGRFALLDAVTVKTNARGRFPDGAGDWMYPSTPTPGGSNIVALRNEIVINEMMYHAPPIDALPAVTSNFVISAINGTWRYHDGGVDPGSGWRAPGFDDSGWSLGAGLLTFNPGTLPAPTGTTLTGNRSTYYFRQSFNFTGPTTNVTFDVRGIVDDGAIFYLNGVEIARQNMPAGPVGYLTSALTPVGDATYANPIVIPADVLVQGANVLAVEVHQASSVASSGIVLSGGGLALVEEGPLGGAPPMNLARAPGSEPFVIDSLAGYPIHNYTGLTDGVYGNNNSWIGNSGSPGYAGVRFSGTNVISSIAFGRDNLGTYSDRTLGTYTLQYTRVPAPGTGTSFTGNPDTGWATIGTMNYQSAGAGYFTAPSRRHRFAFTPVSATGVRLLVPATGIGSGTCIDELEINPPDTTADIVFGAELSLTTTLAPAVPYQNSGEEWVELFNRSSNNVDLTGWRLDGGIDFRFTNGPVVAAGGYVVVAREAAALQAKWPEVAANVVGNFSGRLEGGERFLLRDAAGNPVDEARVFEGGWSDGGGSSLELRDANADHLSPASWADSDESAKATWQNVSYRMIAGQNFGSTRWNEFRVGLLDAGIVLLDDVSVVRDPDGVAQELIQNGSFSVTNGNTRWRILGNHHGEFVNDPDAPGNTVLKITADDRAVMNHNHVETTFLNNTALVNGQLYRVSFRARWVAGAPHLNTRAYFSKLARTTTLPMPPRLGTPAAPNSRSVVNAGPTFAGLQHSPIVPAANQAVTISVRASDSSGVASATLSYRVNPATTFTNVPMTLQSTGVWTAIVPGQTAGRIVQFYVTAIDVLGASAFAPEQGPESRALFQVADGQGTTLPTHELRLIMLDADRDFMLRATNVMSNARNGGTLIYDRAEVFYDVGVKLQGTAAGRIRDGDNYVSYDVDFRPGQFFRGVQNNVGIDRSGRGPTARGQDEIGALQMFHRAGVPAQYADLCYFIAPRTVHTGTAILQLGAYGSGFVDEQFSEAGSVYNMDVTYEPDTTVDGGVESLKLPVPLQAHIGTDFTDLGEKEQYRSPFDIRTGNRRDDYEGLMRLCRAMALPQPLFDAEIASVLDVDATLRMVALEILCGIGDTYISAAPSFPHNLRLFASADGDPVTFLPWDMDFAYNAGASSGIYPTPSFNLGKLMNHPATLRRYLFHIHDLCQTAFDTTYMNPWLTHLASVVGQNFSGASSYIASRRAYALSQLPAATPFSITVNGGNDFAVSSNFVVISGVGWIDVDVIEVNLVPHPVTWASVTNWSVLVPLASGTNLLQVQGVDDTGNRRPDLVDTITITNTMPAGVKPVVINEWMAANAGPGGFPDPADGLFQDWLELYNPNPFAVNLAGFYLTDDLANPTKFRLPTNAIISAQGFLIVWADENGMQNVSDHSDLHANFRLSNGGEELGLFAPDGISPQHTLGFGAQFENVSQGLFPDGAVGSVHFMTNWTPRAANQLGPPPSPQIVSVVNGSGSLQFTIATTPGRSYRVEYKDSLDAPAWSPLGVAARATNATLVLPVSIGPEPQRFFRIGLQ